MTVFVRRKTGFGPDVKLWFLGIYWRGWRASPLFTIGKYTAHFNNGISFGIIYTFGSDVFYLGWLIVSKSVPRIPQNERPNNKFWVLKFAK